MFFQHPRSTQKPAITLLLALFMSLSLIACGKKEAETDAKKKPQAPLISTTTAEASALEIREESIGTLEGLMDPTVAAEAAGRVVKISAHPGQVVKKGDVLVLLDATDYNLQRAQVQAEVARLEALTSNQSRIVERNQVLVQKKFISQNALEDVTTQHAALQQQLDGAKAQIAIIEHTRAKLPSLRRLMAWCKNKSFPQAILSKLATLYYKLSVNKNYARIYLYQKISPPKFMLASKFV